jgi:hypothetical protein
MNGGDYIGIGIGALMAGIGVAIALGVSGSSRESIAQAQLEKARVERGYVLQERDLNGNGLPERFFEIEGRKYFLAIDGKNLEDTLKH